MILQIKHITWVIWIKYINLPNQTKSQQNRVCIYTNWGMRCIRDSFNVDSMASYWTSLNDILLY